MPTACGNEIWRHYKMKPQGVMTEMRECVLTECGLYFLKLPVLSLLAIQSSSKSCWLVRCRIPQSQSISHYISVISHRYLSANIKSIMQSSAVCSILLTYRSGCKTKIIACSLYNDQEHHMFLKSKPDERLGYKRLQILCTSQAHLNKSLLSFNHPKNM